MTAHSMLVGGSTAARRIHCPASFQESLKAPAGTTSIYAEHGTAMHEATAHWLRHPDANLLGRMFNEHVVSQDDLDNLLTPAWNALVDLQETYGGGFKVTHLELQVQFPGIAGAFGTCDIILDSPTHFIVVDLKFGAGVKVDCVDPDGSLNPQTMFYLAGARARAKKRTMVIAIVQPTFEPHLSHAVVAPQQLDSFIATVHDAVAAATAPNPPRARGEHCRFAPCKTTCSLWTGPLLDLTVLGKPPPAKVAADRDWGVFLANAKHLVDGALAYRKEIDSALMNHLKAGGAAPGFALKPEVKNRKWLEDAATVAAALHRLGLPDDKIWQHKLQTFQVVDAAAKRLGVDIPENLRPRPPSAEFVLTYESDPQAVDMSTRAAEFSNALKQLAAGTQT